MIGIDSITVLLQAAGWDESDDDSKAGGPGDLVRKRCRGGAWLELQVDGGPRFDEFQTMLINEL